MSFYGNILYELTNAFAEILIKNGGRASTTTISPSSGTVELPAIGLGGRFTLDSGNKWIHLSGDEDSQVCKIYHSGIDSNNTAYSFTTLSNPSSATDIVQLPPGALLSGEQVYYDEAGHVTGSEKVVYKLPINETEAELLELQGKMAALEESDKKQNESIDANSGGLNNLKSSYETTIKDVQDSLGDVEALVGSKIYMTTGNTSITQAIGSLENMQAISVGNTNSVSASLAYLNNEIAKRDNTISDISTANRYAMEQLIAQIEAQSDIKIDKTLVWPTS